MVKVTCFGGAGSVTGSNYLVETSRGKSVIVDCGLFQGGKEMERRNREPWGYEPAEIKHLILTHAHIDHSGRIPKLVKDGFRGKIVTSPPTAALCKIMLLDSAHVQETEAEWHTRKNRRRGRHDIGPLYTTKDAEESLMYFAPVDLDTVVDLDEGIRMRLRDAGHVLGSSIVELWVEDEGKETKIVFSGDVGKRNQLIMNDPFPVTDADYVFVESTYGNRLHRTFEESKTELLEAIQYATTHDEKVLIPAFALERTQEILYVLGEFARAGQLPDVPIYLDSPLAIKATEIFRQNSKYFDEDAHKIVDRGFDPFDMPNLKFTPSTAESMKINQMSGSAIVIAGNGMCTAGRIKHHLKHNLWRPGASLVIVGFQAEGSTGRQIVDGAKAVTIFGEKVAVKARVFTIGGFSSHADQGDLLRWTGNFVETSKPRVFAVHGELQSSEALAKLIRDRYGLDVYVPSWQEVLTLEPREGAPEVRPTTVAVDVRQEMLTLTGDVEAEIVRLRGRLAAARTKVADEDVDRLQDILEELQTLVSG
jgi:metallo-beta-lactamase family protein